MILLKSFLFKAAAKMKEIEIEWIEKIHLSFVLTPLLVYISVIKMRGDLRRRDGIKEEINFLHDR